MKKISFILTIACTLFSMQAFADCESVITPSQAAALAQNGDQGTYCVEGYVASTVDIYTHTEKFQSFMMADEAGGEAVFEAWRVVGTDHTIGVGSRVRIVNATLIVYNDIPQTEHSFTMEILNEVPTVINLPEYGSMLSVAEAQELCLSFPYDQVETEEMFIVCGYATDVWSNSYNEEIYYSVYIMDSQNNRSVFLQADGCHAIRNLNNEVMPIAEGDFVYITGHLSRYNNVAYIDNGYIATTPVDPFLIHVSADPDMGYATISGKYEFTLADMDDVEFTLTAVADPGYHFLMWIDPTVVRSDESDAEVSYAQEILTIYNAIKDLQGDELAAYLEEQELDEETFHVVVDMMEKMQMPTVTFDSDDFSFWAFMNDKLDAHVFPIKAVFVANEQAIDEITNDQSPTTNKILRNGQLLILRDGKMYNAQGAEIK